MKITLVQMNPVVGDFDGNLRAVFDRIAAAKAMNTDLVIFPEMCLSGYPPKDLVERRSFIDGAIASLDSLTELSARYGDIGVIAGLPLPSRREGGKGVANAAVLVSGGGVLHIQEKSLLPTYDVFDEARYFDPAKSIDVVDFKGEKLGISICEDAWNDPGLFRRRPYEIDPIAILADKGATIMVNVSASPFAVGKEKFRLELVKRHAKRYKVPFVFVNEVGGNDELIFDGQSLYVDSSGVVRRALPMFEEAIATVDTHAPGEKIDYECRDDTESILDALVLGTRDYFRKCGFEKSVVGLSGGVDSAVTLAIAVEALGPHNVRAVAMPSPYSSRQSLDDAVAVANNFGVDLDVVEIADLMQAYERALSHPFAGLEKDVTEENIQARIRGNILMAYSNKLGYLVLSTGNKSELAVGYCTLYGDMSGGLAVISDVPKTTVYGLAQLINRDDEFIPRSVIARAPSAELKPNQTDQDVLPPYPVLDAILDAYVEEGLSDHEIVARGHDAKTVAWVIHAVRANEYKRKQSSPGLKVTSKAFGAGRRFPIAARYDV